MNTIQVGGLLQPGTVDTVLDARARVETLDDIQNIQLPFVGMIFFVRETGRLYIVKTLKSRTIGVVVSENVAVGEYEEVPAMSSLNWFPAGPFLVWNGAQSLRMLSGTGISVGSGGFSTYEDIELDVADLLDTGTIQAGKDYCVYLTTDQQFVVSLNSTFPSGTLSDGSTAFSAENTRKIGGFHTLCVAAGEISGHPLSGFSAGDILPASVWCLNHRPYCEPAGMVYCSALDFWVDIYLQSGTGEATASVFGGTITHTRYQPNHTEDMFNVRKKLLSDEEFSAAAAGSNKKTAFPGGTPPETSGGHVDSAGRRMISDIGCEDCCGMIWHSLRDLGTWGLGESNTWKTLSGNAGDYYGEVNILLAGGACNEPSKNAAHCGPRARNGINGLSYSAALISARGMSPNRTSTEG